MKQQQSVFSIKLELLADELLNAPSEEKREEVKAKINTLKEYEELLTSDTPSRVARKQAPKRDGRKSYPIESVIALPSTSIVSFNYRQYVEGDSVRPEARVEMEFLGFLTVGNQKDTTLALRSVEDVLDLKRGEIYGFQAKSLKDPIISE